MGNYDSNLQNALDFLALTQNVDGGWGYHRDGISYTEPTAVVLMALLNPTIGNFGAKPNPTSPRASAIQKGLSWLRQSQRSDGGWGVFGPDEASNWMTYSAFWLFSVLQHLPQIGPVFGKPEDNLALEHARQWIVNKGREPAIDDNAIYNQVKKLFNIDSNYRGWSWGAGEAGWVIPTSLALIGLAVNDPASLTRLDVVKNGKDYLRDRACPQGGWNVGNPWMLGKQLPPTPDATSYALLAWRTTLNANDFGATDQVEKAVTVLGDFVTNSNSDQTIALGSLALHLMDEKLVSLDRLIKGVAREFGPDKISKKTAKGQDPVTGGWANSPYTTAFAALALSDTPYFIKPS